MEQTKEIGWVDRLLRGDKVLWIVIAVLAVISVLVVYSSTAKMAYASSAASSSGHFLRDQILILCLSMVALLIVHRINSHIYHFFAKWSWWGFLLLTLSVYFLGTTTNGAARWIPVLGFNLQPSEGLKVATILFLAHQLGSRQNTIHKQRIVPSLNPFKWREAEQRKIWREGTWPVLMPMVASCVVIFPAHTSSAVLVFGTSLVMMWIGRVQLRELLKVIGLACLGVLLIMTLSLGRSDTAGGRVSTWVELWTQNRSEIKAHELTDTERSMIAIRNGGIVGQGAGQSAIRVEMTHPESDYAYAFFVEEYGLLMAVLLLMLYLWVFFRAILIFQRCHTAFPALLVLGLGLLVTSQALLHIMVTVNLIPETGQTLPLISRGGSSTLFTSIALGMMLSISREVNTEA